MNFKRSKLIFIKHFDGEKFFKSNEFKIDVNRWIEEEKWIRLLFHSGWFRQYDAHRDDFIERYGRSTEQWLFHGEFFFFSFFKTTKRLIVQVVQRNQLNRSFTIVLIEVIHNVVVRRKKINSFILSSWKICFSCWSWNLFCCWCENEFRLCRTWWKKSSTNVFRFDDEEKSFDFCFCFSFSSSFSRKNNNWRFIDTFLSIGFRYNGKSNN